MGRPIHQAVLFLIAGSVMLSVGASGVRANDPCVANGTTLLCQGDQADGIDLTNTGFDTLLVNTLNAAITPAVVPGIVFATDAGGPLTIRSDTGPFGISARLGIAAYSAFSEVDGATTFSLGELSVFSAGDIATRGDIGMGIYVVSSLDLRHTVLPVMGQSGDIEVANDGAIATYGDFFAPGILIENEIDTASTAASALAGRLTTTSQDILTFGWISTAISITRQLTAEAAGGGADAATGETIVTSTGSLVTQGPGSGGIGVGISLLAHDGSPAGPPPVPGATGTIGRISISSETIETAGLASAGIMVDASVSAISPGGSEALIEGFDVTSHHLISTYGDHAYGILAASTAEADGDGSAPSSASIGAMTIDNRGLIVTRGDAAAGIIMHADASSDTGGGGATAVSASGPVTINSNDVRVLGDNAAGIVVENIAWAISSGRGEAAIGDVTINSHNVTASGDNSTGILAFNLAMNDGTSGFARSGDIVVNSTGAVSAMGVDSVGIEASSFASGTGYVDGDISINILSGSVAGGSGLGAGILVATGGNGTITNHGTVSALSGLAILGAQGHETIDNFGTIVGDVDLFIGNNTFNNHASGHFASGASVVLGAGNALTNAGILSPFGVGTVGTTGLSGDLVQTDSGRYAVDLDFATGSADRIDVSGSAVLAGTVVANPLAAGTIAGLAQQFHILSATGGVTDGGLTAASTAVSKYDLIFDPNGQDVFLGVLVDFAAGGLNPNQTNIGRALNVIQGSGVPASMVPAMDALMTLPTIADLARAYDQLSPETFGQQLMEGQIASEDFSKALMSCREAGGPNAAIREGECLWARARASDVDIAGSATNIGSKSRLGSFAAGLQVAMAADWRIGVALGYDLVSRSTPSGASTDGDRTNIGAVVKYNPGPFLFAAGAAAGWGTFETDRRMAFGGFAATATSKSDTDYVTGWLHAAYLADQGRWYLKPLVEARITELDFSGARETGGGGIGLVVSGSRETMISVSPALEVGTEFRFDTLAVWRPFVRAGVTWRDENAFVTQAAFAGAPLGVPGFHIVTDVDDVLFDISAGVDVIGVDGAVLKVQYDGRFGSTLSQNSVSLKGSVPF